MDPIKCGGFLKELRREKGLTQAQLAEKLDVTNRSVSRWETGTNLPDFDTIIFLSEFYEVDIREILDGQRKPKRTADEPRTDAASIEENEMLIKAAEYGSEREKKGWRKRFFLALSAAALTVALLIAALIVSREKPGENACPPSVFWAGEVYYCFQDTKVCPYEITREMILGKITSLTDLSELPDEDGEANFPTALGAEIAEYNSRLYIHFPDGYWYVLQDPIEIR